ncbi:MAG: hypothetical protein HN704_18375 [Bacteroidetes bacterium]|jgi:hypothetical protein|nr:hypothetical protein [Bacteroidota bacterium]
MKHKLYYAHAELEGDIPVYEFDSMEDLALFVLGKVREKLVYVVAYDDEIFVTHNLCLVVELFERKLKSFYPFYEGERHPHIQEYYSYEEAYKIALAMKEGTPMCYDQT